MCYRWKRGEIVEQLLVRVKHDAQLWHDLLWTSGGKLELQKCGFHLIFYDFDYDSVPSMRKIGDLVITLKNEKGEDIEIRTKKIDEARKNLGTGRSRKRLKKPAQFPVSKTTATETSEAIFTAGVNRQEAAVLYQGVFRPKVEYHLHSRF